MVVDNRGPQLEIACYVLLATSIIATSLRCYVRLRLVKNYGFDDWCMVGALASFISFMICALLGVRYGTGRHYWDIEKDDRELALKYWWFCYMWYCLSMITSKVSIACLLLRITISKLDIWIIHSVVSVTIVTGIAFFFTTLFQCKPLSFFWNKDQPGSCININVIVILTYIYSGFSVICDLTFAILPAALVWRLKMDRRSKIALAPIMAMGCVASAAVIVRFPYIYEFRDPDFLYGTTDIAIWSVTEAGLAITAGSLATLRPLFRAIGIRLGTPTPESNSNPQKGCYFGTNSPKGRLKTVEGVAFSLSDLESQSRDQTAKDGDRNINEVSSYVVGEDSKRQRRSLQALSRIEEHESEEELGMADMDQPNMDVNQQPLDLTKIEEVGDRV